MSKKIWKAELQCVRSMTITVPKDSRALSVHLVKGSPVVWFEVNPKLPPENRKLLMFSTDEYIPEDIRLSYIGTFLTGDGSLEFHLYEVTGKISFKKPKKGIFDGKETKA